MGFTPFARARNFTLENLKMYLNMYPDLLYDHSWRQIKESLENGMKGYSKTYYQQACQFGLEDRSNGEKFRTQTYLTMFSDEDLKKYLNFWFKTYYAPNPFVNSNDEPVLLWCSYAKRVLKSEDYEIDFAKVHEEICGDGKSTDIELNCFKSYGYPLQYRKDGEKDILFVNKDDVPALQSQVAFIEEQFPIEDVNDESFFNRYSYKSYAKFYHITESSTEVFKEETSYYGEEYNERAEDVPLPHNRIIFGAPGTGKSYKMSEDRKMWFSEDGSYERVTFHPAYSYAQFFGCYKPVGKGEDIAYKYIPGPFLRVLLNALSYPDKNYLLIIEEINRANVAATFGDVFQLLDREDGKSEYPIDISDELKDYIADYEEHNGVTIRLAPGEKLYLPANFYLWATMNPADQGVMPLDTAFKRRWTFSYRPIDEGEDEVESYQAEWRLPSGETRVLIWNKVRKQINTLLKKAGVNEDKWLGPFFLSQEVLKDPVRLKEMFASKVLMYLFEDAAKYDMKTVFGQEYRAYSDLLNDFEENGLEIFASDGE